MQRKTEAVSFVAHKTFADSLTGRECLDYFAHVHFEINYSLNPAHSGQILDISEGAGCSQIFVEDFVVDFSSTVIYRFISAVSYSSANLDTHTAELLNSQWQTL